jgi:hypothetical protein
MQEVQPTRRTPAWSVVALPVAILAVMVILALFVGTPPS